MLLHDRVVIVLNHYDTFRIAPTSSAADRMSEATSIRPLSTATLNGAFPSPTVWPQ